MDVSKLHVRKDSGSGGQTSLLVLPSIRGIQPYNPARVLWKFDRRQITHVQGDTISFVIDYNGFIKISLAKTILRNWAKRVHMKGSILENRYEDGNIDEYTHGCRMICMV